LLLEDFGPCGIIHEEINYLIDPEEDRRIHSEITSRDAVTVINGPIILQKNDHLRKNI
jgi:hypothetical protein